MAWKTHWNFENTGATWSKMVIDKATRKPVLKQGGEIKFNSDVEGSCFGYSLEWAHRFITYKDIVKSKPTKVGGTPLQQIYEMKTKKVNGDFAAQNAPSVPPVIRGLGLTCPTTFRKDDDEMAVKVDTDGIVCIFSIGYHWMAMAKSNLGRFFFDSNYGLISADSLSDYEDLVDSFIDDYDGDPSYSTSWDVYVVAA